MPKIEYVSFGQDLFEACLNYREDRLTMVFPTRLSAALSEQKYYRNWAFEDLSFISIDELKKELVVQELPQLEEDKRLLCLYQSMTPEDKDYFHIYAYDEFIAWGQQFFRFFDELWEELIDPGLLVDPDRFLPGLNLQIWQQETLSRVYDIATNYQILIRTAGFADRICTDASKSFRITQEQRSYLFVNQYYYSALEKEIIRQLELKGNLCRIIVQAPVESFDEEDLRFRDLDLPSVLQSSDYQTEHFVCHQYKSLDEAILGLMSHSPEHLAGKAGNCALIDANLHKSYYSRLLRGLIIAPQAHQSIADTFLYQYLVYLQTDLLAITNTHQESFLPLKNILDRISDQRFVHHFGINDPAYLKAQVHLLGSSDYLYVDLDLKIFELDQQLKNASDLKSLLLAYIKDIQLFAASDTMQHLIDIFDAPGGLDCKAFLSEEELQHSDLLERFFEKLANIASIEHLGIVKEWAQLYPGSPIQRASKLLRMLIDSVKTIKYKLMVKPILDDYYELTNLLDSRNQAFERLIFFNTQEGIIPSAPEPVWILNETQRRILGLKNYEQIRAWERYYFFRLLFVSKHVEVYCYQNLDKDEQPSSFISELESMAMEESGLPQGFSMSDSRQAVDLKELFVASKAQSDALSIKDSEQVWTGLDRADFFCIPYDGRDDLGPSGEISGTYYKLDQIIKSPFIWYIRDLCKLRETDTELKLTISRKLFGTVIHQFLAGLMSDLAGKHNSYRVMQERFQDKAELRKALDNLLNEPLWVYKLPHNYNWDFLADIIADGIVDTVWWFFNRWLPGLIGDSSFELYPEEDSQPDQKPERKELILPDITDSGIRLMISGRADLRVETPFQASIIDFKTGKHSSEQLIIYEWFYYILEEKRLPEQIGSYICKILERDTVEEKITDKKRDKYKETIAATINSILSQGFTIAPKLTNRSQYKEITRADRYGRDRGGQHESV